MGWKQAVVQFGVVNFGGSVASTGSKVDPSLMARVGAEF